MSEETFILPEEVIQDRDEETRMVIRRLVGGTFGGMVQALTSHPFDTIKSRVQRGVFPDIMSCYRNTMELEGIRGFYRGVTPPLVMGGVYNSLLFSINQYMMNFLKPEGESADVSPPIWRTAFAGQLTAPVYVLCITPMEKVKVKLQVSRNDIGSVKLTGPVSCISHIMKNQGLLGFFSGYLTTVSSRIVGLPFYFSSYQLTKEYLNETFITNTSAGKSLIIPMFSGCTAGISFWLSNYPFDFIKTQQQASDKPIKMSEIIITTYKEYGLKRFYRGLSACLIRAIPANATVWMTIEFVTQKMKDNGF